MAARRLIIVMLVLLGISTAIAIVAPDPAEQVADSGTTGTTAAQDTNPEGSTGGTGQAGSTGPASDTSKEAGSGSGNGSTGGGESAGESVTATGTIAAKISVLPRGQSGGRKSVSVCARPGSRLILTITTSRPVDVSIPDFGRTASATRYAPAVFDLLMPSQPGRYEVEALQTGRTLAMIASNSDCSLGRDGPKPDESPPGMPGPEKEPAT